MLKLFKMFKMFKFESRTLQGSRGNLISRIKNQDSRFKLPRIKIKNQDSWFKLPRIKIKIQDSRFKNQELCVIDYIDLVIDYQ